MGIERKAEKSKILPGKIPPSLRLFAVGLGLFGGLAFKYPDSSKSFNADTVIIDVTNSDSPLPPKERKERTGPKTNMLGFRVNDPDSVDHLPEGVGIVRIAGDESEILSNGEFANQNLEETLKAAKETGMEIIFVYNPRWFPGAQEYQTTLDSVKKNEGVIRETIKKQTLSIMRYADKIEIGNEPDENNQSSHMIFWRGNIESFAYFFKLASEEINKNKDELNKPQTEIIMGAFADPISHQNQLKELFFYLKNLGLPVEKYKAAIHAYDPGSLKWILENIPPIVGHNRLIVTEMNVDLNREEASKEIGEMLDLVESYKTASLIHEFKAFSADYETDYTGHRYAYRKDDPNLKPILDKLALLISKQTEAKKP